MNEGSSAGSNSKVTLLERIDEDAEGEDASTTYQPWTWKAVGGAVGVAILGIAGLGATYFVSRRAKSSGSATM